MSIGFKFAGAAALAIGCSGTAAIADGPTSQGDCLKQGLCDPIIASPRELRIMKPYTRGLTGVEAYPLPRSLRDFDRECNVLKVGDRYFGIPDIEVNSSSDQCGCASEVAISEYKLPDSEVVKVFGFQKNWCPQKDNDVVTVKPADTPLFKGGCVNGSSNCDKGKDNDNNNNNNNDSDLGHESGANAGGNEPGDADTNGNEGAGAGSGNGDADGSSTGNNKDLNEPHSFYIPHTTVPQLGEKPFFVGPTPTAFS